MIQVLVEDELGEVLEFTPDANVVAILVLAHIERGQVRLLPRTFDGSVSTTRAIANLVRFRSAPRCIYPHCHELCCEGSGFCRPHRRLMERGL